ncbi:transketolase [Henriciella pelagia]|uniref:Transketolase n=1 Tax=Henriciella pelagia TaxID=1977912 RepID=A0ABQ1JR87_9PROT|nr:transketolase [Henriciella pelagia]GGB72757.1 transketolase [Henriciella pelagia]
MAVEHKDMANAIRALSMDAVEQAKSGHVGLPLGMADVATVLWTHYLKHDPRDPFWPDRDRFVLSAGHGSMLIYSLLHLTGYESVTRDAIRNFRQVGQKTPGHPENFVTPGVETTTGPLGQGIATAVGMAMAERHLNARFGDDLVDHKTWVIAGDGCLMEGVSQEAITLAGHLKLNKLIVLFDDNSVTIDGSTDLSDGTDQLKRFEAAGWATKAIDGHNTREIYGALEWAQRQDKPAMIACKTIIGYGAPTIAGTGKAHGGPYGADEIAGIRKNIGWSHEPFVVPEDIEHAWKREGAHAAHLHDEWKARHDASKLKDEFDKALAGELGDIAAVVKAHKKAVVDGGEDKATRQWSGAVLEELTKAIPEMVGGSADLSGSNNTKTKATEPMTPDNWAGRYVHYGVREHGMAAAMNGMALHKGIIPYSGTFLVFADYSRAAIRLGALMGERVIHVMTHDSIGLGEDGPTHQPVEHVASLRAMPNMHVFRPADGVETAECWELALKNADGPSTIALTRQKVKSVRKTHTDENLSAKGAYVLSPAKADEKLVLIATGSEVEIAVAAQAELESKGIGARVVSMPCMELFEAQPASYQRETLGGDLPKIAVEAGVRFGWDRWIGFDGGFVGMDSFGASAPYKDLYMKFGITSEAVVVLAEKLA